MSRLPDWEQRLDEMIAAWRTKAHEYGVTDCLQFVAACVLAMTGVDHLAKFPAYSSEREALVILAKHGGLAGLITHALGEPKYPTTAQHGDVVVYLGGGLAQGPGFGCGIYLDAVRPGGPGGVRGFLGFAPEGMVGGSLQAATAAWSPDGKPNYVWR